MAEKRSVFKRMRDSMGRGLIRFGERIEMAPLEFIRRGSERMQALGTRVMTRTGRAKRFIELGNVRVVDGKIEFKRYDSPKPNPFADKFTGAMFLPKRTEASERKEYERWVTHEERHLLEGLERGTKAGTLGEALREEVIAEYDAMLKHDSIKGKSFPRRRLEDVMAQEHEMHLGMRASAKRAYVTPEHVEELANSILLDGGKQEDVKSEVHRMLDGSLKYTWGGRKLSAQAKGMLTDYVNRAKPGERAELTQAEYEGLHSLLSKTNKRIMQGVVRREKSDETAAETRKNIDIVESMHNAGAPFEEIRAKVLRLKGKPASKKRSLKEIVQSLKAPKASTG